MPNLIPARGSFSPGATPPDRPDVELRALPKAMGSPRTGRPGLASNAPAGAPVSSELGTLQSRRASPRASADATRPMGDTKLDLTTRISQVAASPDSSPVTGEANPLVALDLGFAEPHGRANDVNGIRHDPELRSVDDCLRFIFSCVRKPDASNLDALEELAQRQSAVLRDKGIDDKGKLCDMLNRTLHWDRATSAAHGLAAGMGFNGGSAAINFKGGALIAEHLVKITSDNPSVGEMAALGGIAGAGLSVADVATGPAVGRTFGDAYYGRPPADVLPACMRDARNEVGHTARTLGINLATGFGATYGARNVVRMAVSAGTIAAEGGVKLASTIDDYLDPLGGVLAGMAFRAMSNHLDARAGRVGVQYFLARNDLAECIDALQAPAGEQTARVAARAGRHVVNMVTQLPEGLFKAFTTAEGLVSHVLLAGGFAGVLGARTAVRAAIPALPESMGPLNANRGFLAAEAVKHAALEVLYMSYGAAIAGVALNDPNADNRPYKDIAEAIHHELANRRGEAVVIDMGENQGDVVIEMPEDEQVTAL